jgi:hypothetical protein
LGRRFRARKDATRDSCQTWRPRHGVRQQPRSKKVPYDRGCYAVSFNATATRGVSGSRYQTLGRDRRDR